jgi:hypothetical protein
VDQLWSCFISNNLNPKVAKNDIILPCMYTLHANFMPVAKSYQEINHGNEMSARFKLDSFRTEKPLFDMGISSKRRGYSHRHDGANSGANLHLHGVFAGTMAVWILILFTPSLYRERDGVSVLRMLLS